MNLLLEGLRKIITVFETEKIPYMIVGGFAMSYYNRARFTADIDVILQIYPHSIAKIVQHFPDWLPFLDGFKDSAERGTVFNLTDFETGVKYDFMLYKDSDYNWEAFGRRRRADFLGIECWISTPEDLVISKLIWYGISKSEKQKGDIAFLINETKLDKAYIDHWVSHLNILRYGIF